MKTTDTTSSGASADSANSNPTQGRCLLAVTETERDLFLAGGLVEELQSAASEFRYVSPGTLEEGEWEALLLEYRPDVVVGAWSTRPLPEGTTAPGGPVRYFCGLTGSVRRKVSREQIENGLLVSNWGTSISRTIAESALMMILSCLRRTSHWHEVMHYQRGWHKHPENEGQFSLFGRRVGIHGFGRIARDLALLLKPFDVTITSHTSVPQELLDEYGIKRAKSLESLFEESDVLVELAALTERNRGSVTEDMLRRLPENAVFVNVGRGAVVDEEALIRVAEEGKLRVALDVYAKEPPPKDSPLRDNKNILLMPHQAGPTPDRMRDSGALAVANLRRYRQQQPLEGEVDLQGYDQQT